MPHPRNGGRLGPFLNRNAFCSGHGSASNRRSMISHNTSQAPSKIGMTRMKGQKFENRSRKVFNVFRLNSVTAFRHSRLSF
jgi:hypothetical protein